MLDASLLKYIVTDSREQALEASGLLLRDGSNINEIIERFTIPQFLQPDEDPDFVFFQFAEIAGNFGIDREENLGLIDWSDADKESLEELGRNEASDVMRLMLPSQTEPNVIEEFYIVFIGYEIPTLEEKSTDHYREEFISRRVWEILRDELDELVEDMNFIVNTRALWAYRKE